MAQGLPVGEDAEDLFENAPCGYVVTALDGTILKVNRTFEDWTGLRRADLLGERRFQDLLTAAGRIYHETHFSPLLRMQGTAREIALELVGADGSRLPALVNSAVSDNRDGEQVIRTAIFDAADRRRYEEELLVARRREHEVAIELQRSMLAGTLPAAPTLQIGASYRPAVRGLEVGGDWYDAFWLGPGEIGLVVGDVVGKGIEAATAMGQLRSAIRALAAASQGPASVLEALDAYAVRHEVGAMATVLYAELDLRSRRLRFACSGHLPPLIASVGESPRFLWEGRSQPLAAGACGRGKRPQAEAELAADSLVVLYTDGLVERRHRPIDAGLELLAERIANHRHLSPEELTTSVMRAFEESDARDDVCLLAASLE